MPAFDGAVVFAAGYALVLLACAFGIDALARRAARSVEGHRRGGFVYHEEHDAWQCPQDQWLWPHSFDPGNRVMRYRASPVVCNACPVKETCTPSHAGREIRRHIDPWPASEAARFHRGIACAVTVLAVAWPVAAMFGGVSGEGLVVLIAVTVLVALGSLPLWWHLRRTPADPTGVLVLESEASEDERLRTARAHAARRTSYRSDRLRPAPRTDRWRVG